MSGMVTVVLKMTLGLFVKKARSALSKKLKDGGLNSQQLRSLIVSKLEDVKTKLDGLARGNLLSSASCIQEGLGLLNDSLEKPKTQAQWKFWARGNCNDNDLPLNDDPISTLVKEVNEMKSKSSDHFASAMKLFDNANTIANTAFHNKSLSLEDRILASIIRVQSRLLLSLENPSLASEPCRLYLEQLHGLASLVDDFCNDLEGGTFSFRNKEKRHELVLSVSAINFVVFKFLKSFTKGPIILYDWPNLSKNGWTYNPLIPDLTICMELRSAGIEFPNVVVFKELGWNNVENRELVVNSSGELIAGYTCRRSYDVIFGKVTRNKVETSAKSGKGIRSRHQLLLAVSGNNNMYVLSDEECCPDKYESDVSGSIGLGISCNLTAFDSKNVIDQTGRCPGFNALIPTLDGFALITYNSFTGNNANVAFYKNGEIEHSLSIQNQAMKFFTVTNKYRVVAVEQLGHRVMIFNKDGQFTQEFELDGGEHESCVSIAFNYLTEELVFVSHVDEKWYFLSTYEPDTGKRLQNVRLTLFGKEEEQDLYLTAHCNGPMALVSDECVLYLQ